jgi:hypothetical protein
MVEPDDVGIVMPGLVPGIHVLLSYSKQDVGGRVKPGHDGALCCSKNL